MIPFQDLVAALDNWRMRKGMAVSTGEVPVATVAAKPVSAPMAAPTRSAPMPAVQPAYVAPAAAAATQPRPGTDSDAIALDDAEVEDDLYENEGDDFSMQFGGSGNPVGTASGSIGGAPAAKPPAEVVYADDGDSQPYAQPGEQGPAQPAYDQQTFDQPAEGYDDPAYDEPVAAAPENTVDAPAPEEEVELDEDAEFARLYAAANAGADAGDGDAADPDDATVVGGNDRKR